MGKSAVRVAGRELPGNLVEPELEDRVDTGVRALCDVGHVGVPVGGVGLDVMGADARLAPFDGFGVERSILAKAVHADAGLVIVGREQVASGAVHGDVHRIAIEGDAADLPQPTGAVVDGIAGQAEFAGPAPADEHEPAQRVDGQRGRHPRQGELGPAGKASGVWVEHVEGNAVLPLQGDVDVSSHFQIPCPGICHRG